jgi:membrane protein implicated in regulation of membrane protease activity
VAVLLILGVLREVIDLSLPTAAVLFALWLVKDLALFPLLRSAYEIDSRSVIERLIGEAGTTVEHLSPGGYVRVRGELWRAEVHGESSIPVGRRVTVTGVRESTLLVVSITRSGWQRRT